MPNTAQELVFITCRPIATKSFIYHGLTATLGKLRVSELFFDVPKDYSNPSSGNLRIFARSVIKHEIPISPLSDQDQVKKSQKPWFVYLQGGPGFGCRPPQDMSITSHVLDRGYQMLWLDQRGTGLSSPITAATLALQGNADKQAEYLRLFRADSIVKDCEAIRKSLTEEYPEDLKKWSIFGQSFGGFCAFTYLSKFPAGVREVFTSGGIPPIGCTAEQVYEATFNNVIQRNEGYYTKYPDDIEHVRSIATHIKSSGGLKLPGGGTLTVPRLLTIGITLGKAGGFDIIHDAVLRLRNDLETFGFFTRPNLSVVESMTSFDDAIIYAILHEAIYQGKDEASNWGAYRTGNNLGKNANEFRWLSKTSSETSEIGDGPLYFSGEMIFPFMFETSEELKPLREVAELLAEYEDWPDLYDEAQLAKNEVPIYAGTYIDDLYVNYDLVQCTARKVKGIKQFICNTMYHGAVRENTDELMKELFKLRDDNID